MSGEGLRSPAGDGSSASSSSSGSDFEDIDASPEDIKALEQLRSALAANPRQYEVHCQVQSTAEWQNRC